MVTPRQLKDMYAQGVNISAYLRKETGENQNTEEIIEIAYDLQASSYIQAMNDASVAAHKRAYAEAIAQTILRLCQPKTVLEAGVGEATTLCGVLDYLGKKVESYGFDLSWSRVAYAQSWLSQHHHTDTVLCTGNLFHLPYADNAIDVVYTSHSIEPNGGNEEAILRELYRVARKFLILLEPGYELAGDTAKERMDAHGYCKNLPGYAESLGYEVLEHKLFPLTINPLNPTALTIIRKNNAGDTPVPNILACPKFKTPLLEIGQMLFSPEALVVYPVIGGIPCLRIENGVFASKFQEIMALKENGR